MEKRVGFTLDTKQIEQACEAYVAARLLPDEEASARVILNKLDLDNVHIFCDVAVSKKRKPRKPRKNGASA
jgi:hypothetical protein